jgi:alpha-glucosidase
MHITSTASGHVLWLGEQKLAEHSPQAPFVAAGHGSEEIEMLRGNFAVADELHLRVELPVLEVEGALLRFYADDGLEPALVLEMAGNALVLRHAAAGLNRFWFRLHAEPHEHVWGGGEQMSYLDLRGRRFPLWTSEPGVGRDKSSPVTQQADAEGQAGGDYYTTNYPQPTYLSSRRLAVHVETTAYSVFDFTAPQVHELEIWAAPARIEFYAGADFLDLVSQLSHRFGRPPRLPDWIMQGAVIGLKDGARSFSRLARIEAAGVKVAALWCEDWAGVRQTSFGTRLFWDWCWSASRHPDLPHRIEELAARGIRFMGYANPYLCTDGTLFPLADAMGYLARDAEGATYRVDFGEFEAGIIDLTNKAACAWFAESVLHREMLELGLSGWMADFGEYLPTDARLSNGDAMLLHNAWPTLWAGVNAQAVADRPDVVFFMRAGFTGVQRHNRLLWAGDQCVDFSRHDGIGTVITAALSSGLVGNPYHHSDIGGYTSLYGLVRTPELFMRWTELGAFGPVMRTHEGNRPRANLQLDEDAEVLAHFARFTQIHAHLAPLFARLADEAVATGWPMQRALFLHFPDDPATYAVQTAFLLGADLLVAPVLEAGAQVWTVYLPEGCDWIHLWSGMTRMGGQSVTVASPIGQPPLFARVGSVDAGLFEMLARI